MHMYFNVDRCSDDLEFHMQSMTNLWLCENGLLKCIHFGMFRAASPRSWVPQSPNSSMCNPNSILFFACSYFCQFAATPPPPGKLSYSLNASIILTAVLARHLSIYFTHLPKIKCQCFRDPLQLCAPLKSCFLLAEFPLFYVGRGI